MDTGQFEVRGQAFRRPNDEFTTKFLRTILECCARGNRLENRNIYDIAAKITRYINYPEELKKDV